MSKTPVSLLQEQMMRKGHTPHYELIMDGTGSHDPIFKYQVTVDNISAIGTGRSKKEAKHDAAKIALEKLTRNNVKQISENLVHFAVVESPYKDKMSENSVGQLAELCAINNLPPPDYRLVSDKGPAHAKEFEMSCTVSKIFQLGKGRTKKMAKHMAAQKLLARLKDSLPEVQPDSNTEIIRKDLEETQRIIEKHETKALQVVNPRVVNYKLIDSTKVLEGTTCPTLEFVQNEGGDVYEDSVHLLKTIADELQSELVITLLPANKEEVSLVMISFQHIMNLIQCGKGDTVESATDDAATEMINFLKDMCSD